MLIALLVAAIVAPSTADEKHVFPSFRVDNFAGRELTEAVFEGKTTIVVPTFAKCVIACPLVTLLLRDLDESLGSPENLQFLHLSVNPQWDTEEEIRSHFDEHDIDPTRDPRWLFANGPPEPLGRLLDEMGVKVTYEPVLEGVITEHTLLVLVVGPQGEILGEFDNYFWDDKEMRHALRFATNAQP